MNDPKVLLYRAWKWFVVSLERSVVPGVRTRRRALHDFKSLSGYDQAQAIVAGLPSMVFLIAVAAVVFAFFYVIVRIGFAIATLLIFATLAAVVWRVRGSIKWSRLSDALGVKPADAAERPDPPAPRPSPPGEAPER